MLATEPRTVGTLNIDAVTSAPLRLITTARLNAPLAEVFAIIADHGGLIGDVIRRTPRAR